MRGHLPSGQRGTVLFLALIVLTAMLLSGIALFRTADSGILMAGNIALQKSAVRQGDRGIEAAIAWLETNAGAVALHEEPSEPGYVDTLFYVANALNDQPAAGQGWLGWWNGYAATHAPAVLLADPNTGHAVSYLIMRLCSANGATNAPGMYCARAPSMETEGGSQRAGVAGQLERPGAVFYRIVARIDGPRNTTAFVESIVSL